MSETAGLQKLLAWLSPAFPVGGFAWSAGLESAIAEGAVRDSGAMQNWLEGALAHGGARTDAILVAEGFRHHADRARLTEIAAFALALVPAAERHSETSAMGEAFAAAVAAWPAPTRPVLPTPCPYPVAVGAFARAYGLELEATITGFLLALAQGQISVAVRLVPLGQTAGLAVLAALDPAIASLAREAIQLTLDDIGGVGYAADIVQMRHEVLHTRIFRS